MEVPSYFARYLRAIQPQRASRERAIQLHTTLRDRLAADEDFQDWYDSSFLYGSYKRNTAVQPIKDVDVCVLLDIDPDAEEHTPQRVINRLRRVLERNGYEAKTALQRRSVRIDMSSTTLDVVPVVVVTGEDEQLLIPDRGLTKWVSTHPKGHLEVVTRLNRESNKRFVPLAKIVKAWFGYQMTGVERPKPKGFTLEALLAAYHDPDAPSYAEGFVRFLENLDRACAADLAACRFPAVPDPGMSGACLRLNIGPEEARAFGTLVSATLAVARAALADEDLRNSALEWGRIFGPKFPPPPESTSLSEAATLKARESEYGAGDVGDEVDEVDLPRQLPFGALTISARTAASRGGPTRENYPSNGRSLPKNWWLRFTIEQTSVPAPYNIRWIVKNHGREARAANDMGHTAENGSTVQWEHTRYRGSHTMVCELHQNGRVLARTSHVVNIK